MPRKKLGLLHTSATLVPMFEQLCKAKLLEIDVFNLVDDSLIKDVIEHGQLRPRTARRVVDHIAAAQDAGANFVLATCSSIGVAVETAATLVSVPVLRVDRPMVEHAIRTAGRIGVVATLPTTLEPTTDLIRRCASAAGAQVTLLTNLCEGAFGALMSGDAAAHDASVARAINELTTQVDVIVLAQASMARIVEKLPQTERRIPILTSPPMAIDYIASVI
ncbi:MAG TPA: aspartate/glutamate racemase family protein [Lacipirellulaceae bacterium]|nr:aspartate/glutamate racemase family protein [Lacipirellulaceae bacterium]